MPIVLRKTIDRQGILAVWRIDETHDDLLERLHRLGQYPDIPYQRNPARLAEWMATRTLLAELGIRQRVAYDQNGKPHLEGAGVFLSISHSAKHVVVITHPARRVGVDIEWVGDRIHRVSHKFVSENEKVWLPSGDDTRYLYVIWGAKECAFKIYGLGAVDFKEHLEVLPFEWNEEGSTLIRINKPGEICEYRIFFQTLENMMITYAIT